MTTTSHGIQIVERERVAIPSPPAPADATGPTAPAAAESGDGTVPVGGLGVLGLLTLLVGAWGGIVPFVGPLVGADADGTVSWYWSMSHALLWLAPGAGACLAAALMLGAMPRAAVGFGRLGAFAAGALAMVCGAWFVIGPEAWPVLVRSAGVFVPAGPLTTVARQVGYSFGPGVLLLLLGGLSMGMGMAGGSDRRAVPSAPMAASGAPARSAAAAAMTGSRLSV